MNVVPSGIATVPVDVHHYKTGDYIVTLLTQVGTPFPGIYERLDLKIQGEVRHYRVVSRVFEYEIGVWHDSPMTLLVLPINVDGTVKPE